MKLPFQKLQLSTHYQKPTPPPPQWNVLEESEKKKLEKRSRLQKGLEKNKRKNNRRFSSLITDFPPKDSSSSVQAN